MACTLKSIVARVSQLYRMTEVQCHLPNICSLSSVGLFFPEGFTSALGSLEALIASSADFDFSSFLVVFLSGFLSSEVSRSRSGRGDGGGTYNSITSNSCTHSH